MRQRLFGLVSAVSCGLKRVAINQIRGSKIICDVILLNGLKENSHGQTTSNGVRERVVAFVAEGHSNRAAARHFRVSPRFVNTMMALHRETGGLEAQQQGRPKGGGKLAPHRDWLCRRIAENSDLTLDELHVELSERGVTIHRSSIGRLLGQLDLSHKKV